MKPIIPQFKYNSKKPLYIQLYDYLKGEILKGEMSSGDKFPSLRSLSNSLGISVTTIEQAYNQLTVEGYIQSKPQSGYYVSDLQPRESTARNEASSPYYEIESAQYDYPYASDLSCFDFNKWKKCASRVLTEYPQLLLYESDPQGELGLRIQISRYLHTFRGVICSPDQIVISAGTQQTTGHLSRILKRININNVALESPGYLPVQRIFNDDGFFITHVRVEKDGLDIDSLPTNISSVVYTSPSNQFPTGTIMPVGKRYQLIDWARRNNSYIIEDDYDSELRYFGKPVPALQGLDDYQRVIYLGSFSSTLFPAIKISYMVLPTVFASIFSQIKDDYSQTCSKTEQLTLALFMGEGYYSTGIRKLRKLYSQKLQAAVSAFEKYASGIVTPTNTSSGISIILRLRLGKDVNYLCQSARSIGLQVLPVSAISDQATTSLTFYYNQLPLDAIDSKIKELIKIWSH